MISNCRAYNSADNPNSAPFLEVAKKLEDYARMLFDATDDYEAPSRGRAKRQAAINAPSYDDDAILNAEL